MSFIVTNSVIATWFVGEKGISLHKEPDRLTFSVRNGERVERENQPISTELYGMQRSEELIHIFHEVVHSNFTNGVSQSCFLPVLCKRASILQGDRYITTCFEAGLFGRIALDHSIRGEVSSKVVGARWGVFDSSNRRTSQFPVDEGSAAANFLKNTFGRRREYHVYARQVKPIITCSADGRIESIALRHFSTFDENVMLDEHNWAVTLVSSTVYATVGYCGSRGLVDHGHGLIAYEGMSENHQFLKFAHITTNDRVRGVPDPDRGVGEARVEIFDRSPASLSQGPTWKRTRDLVEKMVRPIQEAVENSTHVKFWSMRDANEGINRRVVLVGALIAAGGVALIGARRSDESALSLGVFGLACGVQMLQSKQLAIGLLSDYRTNKLALVPRILLAAGLLKLHRFAMPQLYSRRAIGIFGAVCLASACTEIADEFVNRNRIVNCISWCRLQLKNAHIWVSDEAWAKITPHAVVNYLRVHPEAAGLR